MSAETQPDFAPRRVLVTDSDTRSALAVTRALGRCGHTVYTAGEHRQSLAAVSRYSARFEAYPSPGNHPREFMDAIVEIAARLRIEVILPTTDITTLLLTRHAARLPKGTSLPFPDAAAVERAADKAAIHELAAECGIPIPKTEFIRSAQDRTAVDKWETYPAVLKPAHSKVETERGWISLGVRYAHSATQATDILRQLPKEAFPVLLQERLVGSGAGVFACMVDGRSLVWFAHERLREKPPSGGVSVLCRSVLPDPQAVRYANQLLTQLQWRGVAMVEFKRDDRDGSLRLMEINGRFWGSLQLAIDAGVNFPQMLVEIATGGTPKAISSYRLGTRSRWLWGDISALLVQLLGTREQLNLPRNHPGRLRALWRFFHVWGRDLHYEMERLSDFSPAWLETRRTLLGK